MGKPISVNPLTKFWGLSSHNQKRHKAQSSLHQYRKQSKRLRTNMVPTTPRHFIFRDFPGQNELFSLTNLFIRNNNKTTVQLYYYIKWYDKLSMANHRIGRKSLNQDIRSLIKIFWWVRRWTNASVLSLWRNFCASVLTFVPSGPVRLHSLTFHDLVSFPDFPWP